MRYFSKIIVLLLILAGCQDVKYPEKPENLLSKEKMVQMLADAYIGNASRSKSYNNRILRTNGVHLDSILYKKHQVDSLTFVKSNAYYASNLVIYTEIMTEVEKLLLTKKVSVDSILKLQKKRSSPKIDTILPLKAALGESTEPPQDEEE
ncbi:MAG: DUF4296 domain-containing protein [Bacteroidetes bacterium]|nr:MAG: DUF4296 domain-containing protein [Bacteroidota bacterium]TDI78183.1 MAG: DUF4296 domain-containing protein [Bacteroidota bacterium]